MRHATYTSKHYAKPKMHTGRTGLKMLTNKIYGGPGDL
jgi:hypothetical protein